MILGTYTLNPGIIWMNEFDTEGIGQDIQQTLLGNVIIQTLPVTKHQMVIGTKESGNRSRGFWTREQIEYLRTAETNGTTVTLQYRGVTYNTIVVAGSISVRPLKEIETVSSDDYYVGTVTLQQI